MHSIVVKVAHVRQMIYRSMIPTVYGLDLSGQIDKYISDLYDLTHVIDWERYIYTLHDLGHVSWVGSALHKSCPTAG